MSTPGWYADPHATGLLRWWDGTSWTGHVQAPAPYPLPDPRHDLGEVLKAGRVAATAQLFAAGLALVTMLGLAVILPEGVRIVRGFLDSINTAVVNGPHPRPPEVPTWLTVTQSLLSVLNAGQLAITILELIWVHRATTFVTRAGLVTRLSPGWAVAGFFVPVVGLWFPYLAVRDVLGASPIARRAGWWWAANLTAGPFVMTAAVTAFISTWLALVMLLVATALLVAAPLILRSIIRASAAVHSGLVALPR